jgi:hypothetical protein
MKTDGRRGPFPARIFPSSLSQTTPSTEDCLSEMIMDKELLDTIRDLSNQYAMAKFGTSYKINIFFGILFHSV